MISYAMLVFDQNIFYLGGIAVARLIPPMRSTISTHKIYKYRLVGKTVVIRKNERIG